MDALLLGGKRGIALSWGSFWTTPWYKLQQTEIVATSHDTLRTPNYLHYENLNVSAISFWYICNSSIASILSRGNCFNMLDNHPSFKYIRKLYPLWHLAKCHHEVEDTHDCNIVAIQQHLLQLCHSLHFWCHLTIHPPKLQPTRNVNFQSAKLQIQAQLTARSQQNSQLGTMIFSTIQRENIVSEFWNPV